MKTKLDLVRRGLFLSIGMITLAMAATRVAAAAPALPSIPAATFNIVDYGAIGDGVATNTIAIQAAIQAASEAGGGTVVVPAGVFLSGPIFLTNSINLQVSSGAMLRMLPYGSYPGAVTFLSVSNSHDVQISGSGSIDGQASPWWAALNDDPASRPDLIVFHGCQRVLVENATIQRAPRFHLSIKGFSGDVTVRNVTISAPGSAADNTGLELAATNCLIQGCSIAIDRDDNVQIGSGVSPASDILVTNCAFGNGHGFSFGSPTRGGISNVEVVNCSFSNTRNGIRLKSDRDRGGVVENISFNNISMANVRIPITIFSYYNSFGTPNNIAPSTAAADPAQALTTNTPIWRNITISNLTATTQSGFVAGILWGTPEAPVTNVVLRKINITASRTFDFYNAHGILLDDVRVTVPGGVSTFTLFNAGITITNSPISISLDGTTLGPTNNSIALFGVSGTSTVGALGTGPALTLANSILTVNGNLNLTNSAALNFQLGTAPSRIAVVGNLALRGALNLSAGSGFGEGSYTLFTYSGSLLTNAAFIGARPMGYQPTLSSATSGQVDVLIHRTQPSIGSLLMNGGGTEMNLAGSGGIPGTSFYVLTSTNLALPLNDWTPVTTNYFDPMGRFSVTNAADGEARFFRLQLP